MTTATPALSGAVISMGTAWFVAGAAGADAISHESIVFSLPVVISAIIATAGFIWWVAKIDAKRAAKLEEMGRELKRIAEEHVSLTREVSNELRVVRKLKRQLSRQLSVMRKLEKGGSTTGISATRSLPDGQSGPRD